MKVYWMIVMSLCISAGSAAAQAPLPREQLQQPPPPTKSPVLPQSQTPTQAQPLGQPQPAAVKTAAGTDEIVRAMGLTKAPFAQAPEFSLRDFNGSPVSLSAFRGSLVLLNFWATWCGPCRAEMPSFQALADKYGSQGFEVLAVNFAEQPDAVRAFVQQIGLKYRVGLDPSGAINRQYHVSGYPTSYVIGRDGAILDRWSGPVNMDQFEKALQGWLVTSN
jgi:thiol-disulfide isomerase/thioredoxin